MYRVLFIILIFSSLARSVSAQEVETTETKSEIFEHLFTKPAPGANVSVVQDQKLDEILLMYMEQNRQLKGIPCYWIRIYSGSASDARIKAYETKGKFLSKYEDIRNIVKYDDPNFKVYIGGYRSKSETLKLLNIIKKDFRTAFIVYDIIDFPEK